MYDGFDIIRNGSTLLELLVIAAIFTILGYLLSTLLGMRKLSEYWARININRNEIENIKKSVNYDDLLTTINTKLATLEKKFSILKVPTLDQLDLSAYLTKDEFRNIKIQNHISRDDLLDFLQIKNLATQDHLKNYLLKSDSEKFALKIDLPKVDLSNYAKKDDLPEVDLSNYAKKSEISSFITKEDIPKVDLSDYALKLDLLDFVSKDSDQLKKSAIDESKFAKREDLEKFALTNQLQRFALKDDLTSYMKFGDFKN